MNRLAQKDLIPMSQRSKEEVKRIAAKGGRQSGITRRKKRDTREAAKLVLSLIPNLTPEQVENVILPSGVGAKERLDTALISLLAIAQKAMKGDVQAFEMLRNTAGEKPSDKVDVTSTDELSVEIVICGDEDTNTEG